MTTKEISRTDRLFAQGVDRLSAACVRWSNLGELVLGQHEPRRWHATITHADNVPSWIRTGGFQDSGKRPATYRRAVQMATNLNALVEQARRYNAEPAVAFAAGSAVLAASIPAEELLEDRKFAHEADGSAPEDWAVTMRVGRDDLRSTLGIWHPGMNHFMAAQAPVTAAEELLDVAMPERIRLADLDMQFPGAYHF
jgi:hypothetical protein